jgi:hypothetical protein
VKLAASVLVVFGLAAAAGLVAARSSRPDCGVMRVAGAPPGSPAVAGRCHAVDGKPVFVPAFPLTPGLTYVVSHADGTTTTTTVPRRRVERTTTVRVYPSAERVPANVLKLYLEFSAPMSIGEAGQRLRLRDSKGQVLTGAFLALEEEMWDAERRRLTLLFDPGRVKRGLRTNLEDGPPLTAGETYALEVDDSWIDAAGAPLASGATKTFVAVSADRERPDAAGWQLTAPRTNTREPLEVALGESLDFALLQRLIRVVDARGVRLNGSISLAEGERSWRFVPDEAWTAGSHYVEVDHRLEDLAGNNLHRLFDADLTQTRRPVDNPTSVVRLGFRPAQRP